MSGFAEMTFVRDEAVCGIKPWLWPKDDDGLWDGPKRDLEECHQENVLKWCKGFDTVVQAGGGCGVYPRFLASKFQFVYTFEPYALSFYCLTNNCQVPNIYKFQAVLGDRNKQVCLNIADRSNIGTNTVNDEVVGTIPVMKIDQLGLNACDLIWLDIEGYERKAIDGALETIKRFRPVIAAEKGHENGIPDLLGKYNYRCIGQSVSDHIFLPQ